MLFFHNDRFGSKPPIQSPAHSPRRTLSNTSPITFIRQRQIRPQLPRVQLARARADERVGEGVGAVAAGEEAAEQVPAAATVDGEVEFGATQAQVFHAIRSTASR